MDVLKPEITADGVVTTIYSLHLMGYGSSSRNKYVQLRQLPGGLVLLYETYRLQKSVVQILKVV